MKGLTLILGLLVSSIAFSQERDTFQPDSVYRVTNVKTRIRRSENAQTKSRLIYNYDRQGRWIEFILTDNFDEEKIQMKVEYKYNDKGWLISETETSYTSDRITESKIEHDDNGRIIKNTKSVGGQLYSVETYEYNPRVEHEQQFRNGTVYREQATYYKLPNYSIRFTGTELADKNVKPKKIKLPNGKVATFSPPKEDTKWDYTFENTLDTQGRLVTRKRFVDGKIQGESSYKYNDKGLLIEKFEKMFSANIETKELFEYKYWD